MVSRIKLVILDYDLTLVDNIYDFYISFCEAYEEYIGSCISFETFYEKLVNDTLTTLIPEEVDHVSFWKSMRSRICRTRYLKLNEGVEHFLRMVNSMGIKTVIVSGKECHPYYIEMELRMLGIDDYIDKVYTFYYLDILNAYEGELFDKSWLLNHVLKEYSVEPFNVVYIGDYRMDYMSSVKVGIEFIGLASIGGRRRMFKDLGVKRIAENFYDILEYLVDLTNY